MATVTAQPNPRPPYDPVKSVQGMFNGSLISIAKAFKNSAVFGPDTKHLLSTFSKRFQDALDDCEVQILEAKWCLEHQLALNKAQREAQALEENLVKRKLEDATQQMGGTTEMDIDHPSPKRQKLEDGAPEPTSQTEVAPPAPDPTDEATFEQPLEQKLESTPSNSKPEPPKPQIKIPEPQSQQIQDRIRPSTSEGFPKYTPQTTPANESFNFESMFGEPTADGSENNLDLDLDLDPDTFGSNIHLDDPSSLNSLLPGVDSYVTQAGSHDYDLNLDGAADNFGGGGGGGGLPSLGESFELPEMGNAFDALLEDNPFGGDLGDGMDDINDPMMDLDSLDKFFSDAAG